MAVPPSPRPPTSGTREPGSGLCGCRYLQHVPPWPPCLVRTTVTRPDHGRGRTRTPSVGPDRRRAMKHRKPGRGGGRADHDARDDGRAARVRRKRAGDVPGGERPDRVRGGRRSGLGDLLDPVRRVRPAPADASRRGRGPSGLEPLRSPDRLRARAQGRVQPRDGDAGRREEPPGPDPVGVRDPAGLHPRRPAPGLRVRLRTPGRVHDAGRRPRPAPADDARVPAGGGQRPERLPRRADRHVRPAPGRRAAARRCSPSTSAARTCGSWSPTSARSRSSTTGRPTDGTS